MKSPNDAAVLVKKTQRRWAVWLAGMPTLVFGGVFAALCAYECTAAPWLTFVIAPAVGLGLGALTAILYWSWASSLPDQEKRIVRRFIGGSILWGPLLGIAVFYLAMMLLDRIVSLAAWLTGGA